MGSRTGSGHFAGQQNRADSVADRGFFEFKPRLSRRGDGNASRVGFSFVQGVLSARRTLENVELLQVALPIEPGNSGGPMLDLHGRVHGVITLKSLVTDNLGFAVPSNLLKPLLEKPNPVPIKRWMTIGQLNPKEWTTVFGGHWRRKGGGIHVSHAGESFGGRALCLSTRNVPETPFELAVEVRLEDESGAAGLAWACLLYTSPSPRDS